MVVKGMGMTAGAFVEAMCLVGEVNEKGYHRRNLRQNAFDVRRLSAVVHLFLREMARK
jgi:hypothetical protein